MAKKSKIPDQCIEKTRNPLIPVEENGKTMIFKNRKRKTVSKIKVDDCAIKDGIKCDWLVKNDKNIEHFVELKGSDIKHACNQLIRSIELLSDNPEKGDKYSFVIAGKVVPAIRTTIQNYQSHFKKKFSCALKVKNNRFEFDL